MIESKSERAKIIQKLKELLINNNQLQQEVTELRQALLHLPGGPIYQVAQENFEKQQKNQ